MNVIQLETPRLILEPIGPEHAQALIPYFSDAALFALTDFTPISSVHALAQQFETWAAGRSPDGGELWLNWVARLRGSDAYLGWFQSTVALTGVDRSASVAWAVFPAYQRRGFAREASAAVIAHLRTAHRVDRIRATIDPRNEPSIRLARALGMSPSESSDETGLLFVFDCR